MDYPVTEQETKLIRRAARYYSDLFSLDREVHQERIQSALRESGKYTDKEWPSNFSLYLVIANFFGDVNTEELKDAYAKEHELKVEADYKARRAALLDAKDTDSDCYKISSYDLQNALEPALKLKLYLDSLLNKTKDEFLLDQEVVIFLKAHPSGGKNFELCKECNRLFNPRIHNQQCCSPKCSQNIEQIRHWIKHGKLNKEVLLAH